jgi:hypothetical protein
MTTRIPVETVAQFELALFPPTRDEERPATGEALLSRLRALGLECILSCRLTGNRTVMVSYRNGVLRLHRAFLDAPLDVLRAIVTFVSGRGAARRRARRTIVAYPVIRPDGPVRRERTHPDDALLVRRLEEAYARLNAGHFSGELGTVAVRISRRMRSRLGCYRPASGEQETGEIAISRRHIRRHGWDAAVETLLHEMIHQWQDERGLALGHGADFRRKAREVGIAPSATRHEPGRLTKSA